MKLPNDFAIFILTHGRPDRISTIDNLEKSNYTGKLYVLIDNEDEAAADYHKLYGDKVVVFDKAAVAETFDEGDNFRDRRAVIYARNACFDIAESLGLKYFMQLDDDYTRFDYRFDNNFQYVTDRILDLDAVIAIMLDFFKSIPAGSIAMTQGGDFLGGRDSTNAVTIRTFRKCMNTFICAIDRPFRFIGRINEDVNVYTRLQNLGLLFLSLNNISITQKTTQHNPGGMTEMYLDSGTYVKSFYTVMYSPSSIKIRITFNIPRLHHSVQWAQTVPCIISEDYKK